MENHIIIKEDGSRLPWKKNKLNKNFCLLYHDNNQKYIFTPQTNLKCQLFMIGGGGAGGYYFGGGGGAGAAYINNNFTFEQGKTYIFSIGTGGTCDIRDFDKLFNSGLSLNIYNNTSPNLNNISFNYDDYSSLGIISTEIIQSLIVNNITINSSIFNTNTTYIWNGYIKSTINNDKTKIITIRLNSKIRTIMWVNTYHYTNENAFISTSGETNIQEVKVLELDPNKFYNIKIIAYNYDNANNANFNVEFVNCKLYNYNKNFENYNVVPATDTTLTFKTISTNENDIISCKGGGTGGYGLYNQNKNLNGGCGGGSGINKIKGISINNNPIYNGNDGDIGDYYGGGGGIISAGNNDKGGEGKILNWFDETLIFGAGGNGGNINEKRNLGYGCGGNGGDCCYFSKSIINNNGNNGCILIYINDIIENFTQYIYNNIQESPLIEKTIDYLKDNNNALASKLIFESFQIAKYSRNNITIENVNDRETYFTNSLSFGSLAIDNPTANVVVSDNNDMHNFIYDVLVISKIYAVAYRLLYSYYTTECKSDIGIFALHMANANIKFTNNNTNTYTTNIFRDELSNNTIITFNNLFSIENLLLDANTNKEAYEAENSIYIKNSSSTSINGSPNLTKEVFNKSIIDICGNTGFHVPAYHNIDSSGTFIKGFQLFKSNTDNYNNINKIVPQAAINADDPSNYIYSPDVNNSSTNTVIKFLNYNSDFLTRNSLNKLAANYKTNIESNEANINKYGYTRILLYLEAFNNILNTNTYVTLLPMLKYQMFNYNAIIYNVILQYEIFLYQIDRIQITTNAQGTQIFSSKTPTIPISNITTDITNLTQNLDKIINNNINISNNVKSTINEMVNIINVQKETETSFKDNQVELNKTINKYNIEYDNNNNIIYYYKIIIIIALFLVLLIFFIFTLNSIDNNTKIGLFIFLILFVIILLVYYNNTFVITENFVIALNKNEVSSVYIPSSGGETINYSTYKTSLINYNNKILKIMTNSTINKDMLFPIKIFSDKANTVRRNKAEYYKLKKINLENGIDILKKTTNNYYYMILLIIISIIILLFSLILLLLNPNMLVQVIALAVIFLIILIYYISYKINRSTRLAENKNYWANYNPSKTILNGL